MPSVLPASSTPMNCERSAKRPSRRATEAGTTFRASASIRPIVCSATELAFAFGVKTTGMPRAVAASQSMLSTPTPCLAITFKRGHCSRSAAPISNSRTMTASATCSISRASASVGTLPSAQGAVQSQAASSNAIPHAAIGSGTNTVGLTARRSP